VERRGKRIAYDRTRSLDKQVIVKNSAVILSHPVINRR
jgi:hypothetical protein